MPSLEPIKQDTLPYNADINLIASVPDQALIYEALSGEGNMDRLDARTERTNNRLQRVIRVNLLQFYSEDHQELIQEIYTNDKARASWNLVLFWQLALTNRMVFEILDEVFFNYYFEGRASLPKQELVAYLKHRKILSSETGKEWSDSTIERIASKLLTFLKRLDVMEGTQVKKFKSIILSPKELTLFCYLMASAYPTADNFLDLPFRKFCFVSKERFVEQVKKLAVKDWLDFQFDGVKLKIIPNHTNRDIVHALFH